MWQGDPSLGQPPGLLQLLRAIPPELPAQRVADPSCLTVQRQPGAPRRRRAGGGRGRRRHSLPGVHVTLLTFLLFQPFLPASPVPPPATPVRSRKRSAGNLGARLVLTETDPQQLMNPAMAKCPVRLSSSKALNCYLLWVRMSAKSLTMTQSSGRSCCCC